MFERDAQRQRRRGRSERVRDEMVALHSQPNVDVAPGRYQPERRDQILGDGDRFSPHLASGAEGDHRGFRAIGHRCDGGVVGVQHGDALDGERFHEFALAEGDGLHTAELAGVRLSDGRDDADRRPSRPAEGGDVPDTAGTHFEHDRSTVVGSAEQGQGNPDLVVERAKVRVRDPVTTKDSCEKIFRRRLTDRSGDPDDGSVTETISGGGAERSESVVGGRHLDHDGIGGLDRLRGEGRHRTGPDCGRYKVMTIAFSDKRNKEPRTGGRVDLARVLGDAIDDDIAADEAAADSRCDLGGGPTHDGSVARLRSTL